VTSAQAKIVWRKRLANSRNAFWRSLDFPNAKTAGQVNARRFDKQRPLSKAHTLKISDNEWNLAQVLAAEQPGWVTAHGYLRRVIVEHLEREAARIRWEAERAAAAGKAGSAK
jgi:hypothetical protein